MEVDSDQKQEALRLKAIAEAKYNDSNIKSALKHIKKAHRLCPNLDGLSSMLSALKILRVASKTQSNITDWYKILQVEPFSHINTIKKEYKKLALNLHPDKNSYLGCEEAFKLVGEGFRVLSDKIRRKEYDMRLRIMLQEQRVSDNSVVETFWTACSRCRLLHQFDRRYLGHNLVCPSCKMSFEAVEVEERYEEDNGILGRVRYRSERLRRKLVGEEFSANVGCTEKMGSAGLRRKAGAGQTGSQKVSSENRKVKEDGSGEWGSDRLRNGGLRRKMNTVDEVLERSRSKRAKFGEEMMTLAEMRLEAKRKVFQEKEKLEEKQEDVRKKTREKEQQEKLGALKKLGDTKVNKSGVPKKSHVVELGAGYNLDEERNLGSKGHGATRRMASAKACQKRLIMAVDDCELYDFNRDRGERSFKIGQVWALYDDSDGLPRCYGLIDEVVSVNPFVVKLNTLDLQGDGDEGLIGWKKKGFHVACGKFKVSRNITVKSLNMFSHVVHSERAAREIYRIYPVKWSVWSLHKKVDLGVENGNTSARDKQCFEIVVILTSYSEMHGLSMAYLERVDGFNTVYRRREVGVHAIGRLEKNDVWLLSHQIPARKLSGDEVPALLKDCWELDPVLLPLDDP